MNAEQHTDLEAIRQLKARYFRFMDTQQWESWSECFTSDISAVYEGGPRASDDQPLVNSVEGLETLIGHVRRMMTGVKSIHQGYMPEIELTSATTASGIWLMFDYVRLPTCNYKGWGHYHEDFVKEDGRWKIKKIHLTRLHTEEEWL
jgi:hypothetical protein